jgi:2,5-diamino-6-(ribosylamino)-4(3H)-pyrimidinone 5'-phosphate reductase
MSRPFVFINTAITADGKIDTVERRGATISSQADKTRVDRLRAESDAVMVGGRTLIKEDPSLTVKTPELREWRRQQGLEENPIKVGIVSNIEGLNAEPGIPDGGKFLTAGSARVILFTSERTSLDQLEHIRNQGAEVFVIGQHRVDLVQALHRLWELGVRRLMVEGGGTLNAELIRLGVVDEIYLYIAPMIFGGASAPTLADGLGMIGREVVHLQLKDVQQTDEGGLVVSYSIPK